MNRLVIGAIADDFTGATDLAGMIARTGLETIQTIGVEGLAAIDLTRVEAVVVALKSRSIPTKEAVAQSLAVLDALEQAGTQHILFKYCSTFDSTAKGNIGPVAEALADRLKAKSVPFVPSFPENGRTVYQGHMFVHGALLNESGMQNHPLNPMRDANLVRVLAEQSTSQVGLLDVATLRRGVTASRERVATEAASGKRFVICDTIEATDLHVIAEAYIDAPLITGGSAIGWALARLVSGQTSIRSAQLTPRSGRAAIVAGSCSSMTLKQIAHFRDHGPAHKIDVAALAAGKVDAVKTALDWARGQPAGSPVLVYASDTPEDVARLQKQFGVEKVGHLIEDALAAIARGLVESGVSRLIVAGGETSGAVTTALGVKALAIGPEIGAGVPWTQVTGSGTADRLCLALKSGNFGGEAMFTDAFALLDQKAAA